VSLKTFLKAGILLVAAVAATGGGSAPSRHAYQLIGLDKRDYQSNVRATDSEWFYKNTARAWPKADWWQVPVNSTLYYGLTRGIYPPHTY
jgi:hypothetical protein